MTIVPAIRPCGRGFTIRNLCIRFYIKSPKFEPNVYLWRCWTPLSPKSTAP